MHEIQGQVQEGDKGLADVTALSSFTVKGDKQHISMNPFFKIKKKLKALEHSG